MGTVTPGTARTQAVRVKLIGISPLLMNNPASMLLPKAAGGRQSPEAEAEAGLYASEDGKLYVKFDAIRTCALHAAGRMGLGKTAGLLAGSLLNANLEEPCWLYDPETGRPLTRADYVEDLRPVVVGRRRIMRARPKIMKWATEAEFILDSLLARPEDLKQALLDALAWGGKYCGIGDYRPERGGPFGRFRIEVVPPTASLWSGTSG
jgi:hypothetical protein